MVGSFQLHGAGTATPSPHPWAGEGGLIRSFRLLPEHIPLSPLQVPGSMSCDRTEDLGHTWFPAPWQCPHPSEPVGHGWQSEWGGGK